MTQTEAADPGTDHALAVLRAMVAIADQNPLNKRETLLAPTAEGRRIVHDPRKDAAPVAVDPLDKSEL